EAETEGAAVLGSWRVAPGTADVVVTRAEGSPPSVPDAPTVAASLAGFHDTKVQVGIRYYYRIRAVFVSDGGERWITPGIVRWATPEATLVVVHELRSELLTSD